MRTKVVDVPHGPSRLINDAENIVTVPAAPWESESRRSMPAGYGMRVSNSADSADPYRMLWWSILERAIMDTVIGEKNSSNRVAMGSAQSWFERGGEDFRMVCTNAGFDPDFVRDSYLSGKMDPYAIAVHKAARVKSDVIDLRAEMDKRRRG